MLKFIINRIEQNPICIVGDFLVYGENNKLIYKCHCLENPIIGPEPNQDLAIPYGVYDVTERWSPKYSPKFNRKVLHVHNDNVPAERYILLHNGNYAKDTLGCILLGKTIARNEDGLAVAVSTSVKAVQDLFVAISNYTIKGSTLTIVDKTYKRENNI